MANWLNPDGLFLKFGPANAGPTTGGEYHHEGPQHIAEFEIDLTTVIATDGKTFVNDQFFFPKNARIEEVDILVLTAATGATATLNVGLTQTDRATVIDNKAFVSNMAVASLSAGAYIKLVKGSTSAGTLIGTTTSATLPGYVVADWDTAAFTAGKIRIRIFYSYSN